MVQTLSSSHGYVKSMFLKHPIAYKVMRGVEADTVADDKGVDPLYASLCGEIRGSVWYVVTSLLLSLL